MAKTKTPFLSLDAHGSIGGSITAQKRYDQTLLRETPFPEDPKSLPQLYQRWLYQDYAHLWTLQSDTIKAYYRQAGLRFRRTAFQHWMSICLRELPHLLAYYKLDQISAGKTFDSSSKQIPGTCYNATLTPGPIGPAIAFNGTATRINFGIPPHLTNLTKKSVFLFLKAGGFTGTRRNIYHGGGAAAYGSDNIFLYTVSNLISIIVTTTAPGQFERHIPFTPNTLYHVGYTWNGTTFQAYSNGAPYGAPHTLAGTLTSNANAHELGHHPSGYWYNGLIDQLEIFDFAIDALTIQRHALRRYPP